MDLQMENRTGVVVCKDYQVHRGLTRAGQGAGLPSMQTLG